MNFRAILSVALATALQFLPLCRLLYTSRSPVTSGFAVVFKWAAGSVALLGSYHAVSGASTVITSPTTARGTNGVLFSYRITAGPDVPNRYKAEPLPLGLTCNQSSGKITGVPTMSGAFNVVLTASDSGLPDRTTTEILMLTIEDGASSTPVTIEAEPVSRTVTAGDGVTFSVTATGSAPITYQWKKDEAILEGVAGTALTIDIVTPADAGTYSVVVTNPKGSVTTSGAVLTVNVPVEITEQPRDLTVTTGADAAFTVLASGSDPLAYQWRFNGAPLANGTNATLFLSNVQSTNAGTYVVTVTNPAGSVDSVAAHLTVQPANELPLTLSSADLSAGVFAVQATGPVNTSFILWTSTDLVQWTPVKTNFTTSGSVNFVDPAGGAGARFYRGTAEP